LDLVRFRLVPAEPVVVEEEELEELEALGDETLSPPLRRALDIFAGGVYSGIIFWIFLLGKQKTGGRRVSLRFPEVQA